jgi:hypothetical protein
MYCPVDVENCLEYPDVGDRMFGESVLRQGVRRWVPLSEVQSLLG